MEGYFISETKIAIGIDEVKVPILSFIPLKNKKQNIHFK
jgi:hypothetical protein